MSTRRGARACSRNLECRSIHFHVRPTAAAGVAASALVAQGVFSLALPSGREIGLVMLFVLAAVGLLVGRTSRQTVPLWFVVALSAAGMPLVLVGLAVEENASARRALSTRR
jgi:hypothetical protein